MSLYDFLLIYQEKDIFTPGLISKWDLLTVNVVPGDSTGLWYLMIFLQMLDLRGNMYTKILFSLDESKIKYGF